MYRLHHEYLSATIIFENVTLTTGSGKEKSPASSSSSQPIGHAAGDGFNESLRQKGESLLMFCL